MSQKDASNPARHPLQDALVEAYDKRAATYDSESRGRFHNRLAIDMVKWASAVIPETLRSPIRMLDLCCGTGLVSVAALDIFGTDTVIDGVDISLASLEIAKSKASKLGGSKMRFFHSSVTDLEPLPLEKSSYSLITCCSAVVLLPCDLQNTLRMWATYLRPGGVIIFDVPAANTQRLPDFLSYAVRAHGIPTVDRDWIHSEASVQELISKSSLYCHSVFTTTSYETDEIQVQRASEIWERATRSAVYNIQGLTKGEQEEAKVSFMKLMKDSADEDGILRDDSSFYIAIAIKTKQTSRP